MDIEDKWTIFPIPMITQSGDYYSRGILLYENNFLGKLGTIASGIFFTNSGLNGLLYWQENNVIRQNIGMKIILFRKSDLSQFERNDKIVNTFETSIDSIILTPNYSHGRHDHKIGPIYINKKVFDSAGLMVMQSEILGLYYRHHYNDYKKLTTLYNGLKTTYDFFLLPESGKYNYLHGGDIQYIMPTGNNYFKIQTHYYQTNHTGFLSPKILGGMEGHRGYDRESLMAQRNLGLMLEQEIHRFGDVHLAFFYEFNKTRLIKPMQNGLMLKESTVGANISYYFEQISIPAIIFEYARNIDDASNHVHVNVGLKF